MSGNNKRVTFAPTVILAYTDITAAASRAVFGLEEKDVVYETIDLPTLEGAPPACIHGAEAKPENAPMDPIQIINCKFDQSKMPKFTFIIINTYMVDEKSHFVARRIVELCADSGVLNLVVLSSQRLDIKGPVHRLYENVFCGMTPVTQRPALPGDILISDAFLNNLIQICSVEWQPFTCLTAPAHRIGPGQANNEDGSLQLVQLFQSTIADFSGLQFSDKLSSSLMYKGPLEDVVPASLMYA
ncbi:uncharacterized protein LOC112557154 [Pomacea canaliculata]|nr:uncharacterized protein LOC112557154 [Pomacea canaliculata]